MGDRPSHADPEGQRMGSASGTVRATHSRNERSSGGTAKNEDRGGRNKNKVMSWGGREVERQQSCYERKTDRHKER